MPELGRAVLDSGRRDELTVTSRFWGEPVMGFDEAMRDFAQTEEDLGIGPTSPRESFQSSMSS